MSQLLATIPISTELVGTPCEAMVNVNWKKVGSGADELVSVHIERTIHLITDVVA